MLQITWIVRPARLRAGRPVLGGQHNWMRVLIIGATGLLGKVLVEEWGSDQILGVGSRDADIRDGQQVRELFDHWRPDCTVLAAAYTDVDGCENDPRRANEVNCAGAVNVGDAARRVGSRLIFLSTDYVFDGAKTTPYEVEDQVCPINVYGESKANAERALREVFPASCIVRTSWLFGANGRCFPNTILEKAQGSKQLAVVNDQTGSPTFNRDLARAIVKLARADARGTFHLTNARGCSWYDFACELIRAAGVQGVVIRPVSTKEFPRPARRPAYSVLSGRSVMRYGILMRRWQETLADYFAERLDATRARSGGTG